MLNLCHKYGPSPVCITATYLYVSQEIFTFHDGGRYHIETRPVMCSANQWTGFYMITASAMKYLKSNES